MILSQDACLALEVEAAATEMHEMHGSKDAARLLYQRALNDAEPLHNAWDENDFFVPYLRRRLEMFDTWSITWSFDYIWLMYCMIVLPFAFASFGSWMFAPWTSLDTIGKWQFVTCELPTWPVPTSTSSIGTQWRPLADCISGRSF